MVGIAEAKQESFRCDLKRKATLPLIPPYQGLFMKEKDGGVMSDMKEGVSDGLSQVSIRARISTGVIK